MAMVKPQLFFIRENGWSGIVNDVKFASEFDPNIDIADVWAGNLGILSSLALVTDAYDDQKFDYDFDVQASNSENAINFRLTVHKEY